MLAIRQFASSETLGFLERHKCQACGRCCCWPGNVFLYPADVSRVATWLRLTQGELFVSFCRIVWWFWKGQRQYRVCPRHTGNDCAFLEDGLCSIHAVKPLVCRAGPAGWHWVSNASIFSSYVRHCPGFRGQEPQDLGEVSSVFTDSWQAEYDESKNRTLGTLGSRHGVSLKTVSGLPRQQIC